MNEKEEEDPIKKGLNEYHKGNYILAINLLTSSPIQDDKINEVIRISYFNLAVEKYNSSKNEDDYNQSIDYYKKSISYCKDEKKIEETKKNIDECNARIYFLKAKENFDQENYENAIVYYKKALEYENNEKNKKVSKQNIATSYFNLGILKMNGAKDEKDYNSAIEFFEKSIEIEKELKRNEEIKNCETKIKKCNAYIYLEQCKKEEENINKLSKINLAIENWPEEEEGKNEYFLKEKSNLTYKIGIDYFNEKNYELARKYFQMSLDVNVYPDDSDESKLRLNYINMSEANIYYLESEKKFNENNFEEALNEIEKALNKAEKTDKTYLIEQCKEFKEKILKVINQRKKNIIWVDKNIYNSENKGYQTFLNEEPSFTNFIFTEVEEAIAKLKEIKFQYTFVLTSGSYFPIFIEEYKKEYKNLYVIPKILIFTMEKGSFMKNYGYNLPINDPILNSGGVFDSYQELHDYILSQNFNFNFGTKSFSKTHTETITSDKFTFEYISSKEELIAPIFYKYLIVFPSNEDINYFSNNLVEKYKSSELMYELINQCVSENLNVNWPKAILSKYWLRAYTLETNFYRDMNKELREGNFSDYQTYFQLLYSSLKDNSIKYCLEGTFYRGSYIDISEIKNIEKYIKDKKENLPSCVTFSKSFLSFALDENVALNFMNNVMFIITINKEIDEMNVSNIDLHNISYFGNEREILFLPFSIFEVSKLVDKENYYEIHLNYLGKYRELFKNEDPFTLLQKKLPQTEFLKASKVIVKQEIPFSKINCLCKFKNEGIGFFFKTFINEQEKKFLITTYQIMSNEIKDNFIEFFIGSKTIKINLNDKKVFKSFNENLNYYCVEISNKSIDNCFEIDDIVFSNKYEDYKKQILYLVYPLQDTFSFSEGKINNIEKDNIINHSISYDHKSFGSPLILNQKKNYKIIGIQTENNSIFFNQIYDKIEDNYNKNFLISFYNIENENINKEITILNDKENKKEIDSKLLYIKLNKEKKSFNYKIKFEEKGKNEVLFFFKSPINNLKKIFSECKTLTSVNLNSFNFSKVNNLSCMFSKCTSLNNIILGNLENIDTSNVTNMYSMFSYCSSLKNLNLSNLNTNNVNDMSYLFYKCTSLENLNLSNFSNEKVTNMSCMFSGCLSLKDINLDKFYTHNVTNFSGLFWNCESLSVVNLNSFVTKNVTNMFNMFCGCKNLEKLDLSKFNTQNVINMNSMFSDCKNIKKLNLENFNFENVSDMSFMFNECESLLELNLKNFNNNNINEMQWVFLGLNKNCNIITKDKKLLKEFKNS